MVYLKYILSFFIVNIAKIGATILAPIAALMTYKDENGLTQLKWKWIYTHDTHADTWWTDEKDRTKFLLKGRTQEDWENKAWLRWACRVFWIWRNPAYGLAHKLGYDQTGMVITVHKDEGELWDSGYPNTSYWTAVNAKGQKAFMFQKQIYWFNSEWCIEIYLGWKLFRKDPDKVCMTVVRISPFKKYVKKG